MKKEIKGVIFDLDDTLINASRTIEKANKAVLNEMKKDFKEMNEELFKELDKKTNEKFNEVEFKERMKGLFYELFRTVSKMPFTEDHIRKYSDIFEEHIFNRIEFTEGVREVIGMLKAEGLKIGLLTGEGYYPGSKTKTLERIDFIKNFDVTVVAKVDIDESKKTPDAFIKTASLMDLKPDEIIFVGDTPETDIDNAKESGMLTVLFDMYNEEKRKKTKFEADYIIDDMKELYEILNVSI
jgi:putative hydrolase of the HAD superfamily